MNGFASFVLVIVCIITCLTIITAIKNQHIRRMALRNIKLHLTTSILTVIGASIGTILIVSALLLQSSLDKSVDQMIEQHLGPITGDFPATMQHSLQGKGYYDSTDLDELFTLIEKHPEFYSYLSAVGFESVLMKVNEDGDPLVISPKTYVHAFDLEQAQLFDSEGAQWIPELIDNDKIVLSERAANQLEARVGETIVLLSPELHPFTLTVQEIVPEQGLTGYLGADLGQSTAIVNLTTARNMIPFEGDNVYTNIYVNHYTEQFSRYTYSYSQISEGWQLVNMVNEVKFKTNMDLLPLFLMISVIVIIIGIVLIINIFKMIAEERRKEFGILRSVGMKRSHLSKLLRIEGFIYAIVSAIIGSVLGTVLAYGLLLVIRNLLSDMLELDTGIRIDYVFFVDASSIIIGMGVGIILIYTLMWNIARKTAKISIVQALQTQEESASQEKGSKLQLTFRLIAAFLFLVTFIGIYFIYHSDQVQVYLHDSRAYPLIVILYGTTLMVFLIGFVISSLGVLLKGVEWLFRPFNHLRGIMRIALRYPDMNRMRMLLLVTMFASVFFLTSFVGTVGQTLGHLIQVEDPRIATRGYDLLATTTNQRAFNEWQTLIYESEHIKPESIEGFTTVDQATLTMDLNLSYYQRLIEESSSFVEETFSESDKYITQIANGIDDTFLSHNELPVIDVLEGYNKETVWESVVADPNLIIVSEQLMTHFEMEGHKLSVGDTLPIRSADDIEHKQIIAIAEFINGNWGYTSTYGLWMQKEALHEIVPTNELETMVLMRVKDSESINDVSRGVEKAFTLQGIYPLHNPYQIIAAGVSFINLFMNMLEGYSAIACVIGIVGLLVIMLRVVRERRQQLGMLRAIGIRPRTIYAALLIESTLISGVGIVIGMMLGAYTGNSFLTVMMSIERLNVEDQPIEVMIPYFKLSVYFVLAMFISIICSIIPARKSLKLTPAEATRYVGS